MYALSEINHSKVIISWGVFGYVYLQTVVVLLEEEIPALRYSYLSSGLLDH